MENSNKKNIVIIISIIVNVVLLLSIVTKKEDHSNNKETLTKLNEILALQKNKAIGTYINDVKNTSNDDFSEDLEDDTAGNLAILKQEVRKILKDELSELIDELKDSEGLSDEKKVAAVPFTEQKEAYKAGNSIVNSALSAGKWTGEDIGKLRDVFHKLNGEQQEQILKN